MADYIKNIRKKIGHDRLLVAGAGVMIHRDGSVLLQERRDNHCWSLHGGCIEIGETVEDAARRELLEETGLTAHSLSLLGVFSGPDMLHTYPNGDEVYTIFVVYLCDHFSGTPLTETDETCQLRWFPIDALPENINPPERAVFAAFLAHHRRS